MDSECQHFLKERQGESQAIWPCTAWKLRILIQCRIGHTNAAARFTIAAETASVGSLRYAYRCIQQALLPTDAHEVPSSTAFSYPWPSTLCMHPLFAKQFRWLEAVPVIVRVMRAVPVIVAAVLVLLLGCLLGCLGLLLLVLILLLVLLILVARILLLGALELPPPRRATQLSGMPLLLCSTHQTLLCDEQCAFTTS